LISKVEDHLIFRDEEYIPQGNKNPLLGGRFVLKTSTQQRHPCRLLRLQTSRRNSFF